MSEPRQVQRMGNLSADFWQRQGDIGMLEYKDVYPDDEAKVSARGLWARRVNRASIGVYENHFRAGAVPAGVIPAGFAWAVAAPFAGAPFSADYAHNASFMKILGGGAANRYFLCCNLVGDPDRVQFYARMRVSREARLTIRVDDGTDNNYMMWGPWGDNQATAQLYFTFRVGGGAVTDTLIASNYPMPEYYVYALNWIDAGPFDYCRARLYGEEGDWWEPASAGLSATWVPARIGFHLVNAETNYPAYCDWFKNEFV